MTPRPEVIIAGGGVIGCLTAYYLGHHGLSSVIIEKDAIASQASGSAPALLGVPQGEATTTNPVTQMIVHSLRLHRELRGPLQEESSIDYQFAETPVLHPAFTENEEINLRAEFNWQQERGLRVSWLDGDSLRKMSPWLRDTVRCALSSAEGAQVESYSFTVAASQAAKKLGATEQAGEVVGIIRDGHRARGVILADGTVVEGGSVVLAMGPWTCYASVWLDFPVPVEPLRGQLIKLAPPGPMPEYAIFRPGYCVIPKPAGYLIAGTTEEYAGFVREVTPEGQRHIMDGVIQMAPALEKAQILETRACLRPLSGDNVPIIGRVPGWDNVYLATGHGREGILLSPATAKHLAELIATGRSEYDLSPFSPKRFSS